MYGLALVSVFWVPDCSTMFTGIVCSACVGLGSICWVCICSDVWGICLGVGCKAASEKGGLGSMLFDGECGGFELIVGWVLLSVMVVEELAWMLL
jgi:hypothetical protein